MNEDKRKILTSAFENVDKSESEVKALLEELDRIIEAYTNLKEEYEHDEVNIFSNDEIRDLWAMIRNHERCIFETKELIKLFNEQMNKITDARNFTLGIVDISEFRKLVGAIKTNVTDDAYDNLKSLASSARMPFLYGRKDITKINDFSDKIFMEMLSIDSNNPLFNAKLSYAEKQKIINETKEYLIPIYNFYQKSVEFFKKLITYFESNIDNKKKRIEFIKKEEHDKKINEAENVIYKAKEHKSDLDSILLSMEHARKLYEELKDNEDENVLHELTDVLLNISAISQHDSKILTYKSTTKETPKEQPKKEEKNEIKETVKVKEIDSDYFRRKDTVRIICFLGEGNPIMDDINNYYDKPAKIQTLEKISNIFNQLFSSPAHIARTGGDPSGATSKKTLTLLDPPYNFTYRRYGEKRGIYRLHAIKRHSNLLEELGYGSGDIVFFGSIGPNDDNEKKFAYNRLGSRAVDVANGKKTKLQPSFNNIEHITRGYIPISLLSDEDKEKLKKSGFSCKLPGGIEQTIEDSKYILFESLDNTSKNNVKKWLEDYFIEQTNKLFEMKDSLEKLKGETLD